MIILPIKNHIILYYVYMYSFQISLTFHIPNNILMCTVIFHRPLIFAVK